ncbi:MAG: glycoside-pentoside-hexuronide (GPH):cation symporter [Lachnospiraceae bacterium]|nr:glycoside-pentoside-hexuronide (GPH):cation symporter [Lachnospiraceae bacterium]
MGDKERYKKNLLFYPLGTVGRDMTYCLVTSFLLTYIMFTRSLTKPQLAAITGIMVFARVFDALNDPIMGNIIESTRTKWGKFKPWLFLGVISTSFVVYFAFSSKLQGWEFIIFFGIIYILYSITYTMSDISYWGMVPALSSDADERNTITARATLFAGIGSVLASVLIPLLTTGKNAWGGSATTGYSRIALAIGILSPIFITFTLAGVRENRAEQSTPPTKVSMKKIISTVTGNDQLLWMCLIFLFEEVSNMLIPGGMGATYLYFQFGYDGGLYSLFTTVGMAATAILMIFYPNISRKIHRKPLMGIMMTTSAIGYALMLLSGLVFPASIKFPAIVIGYMCGNFGNYCFYLIMMISIMNTVEYNEYKYGTRDEGIITSLRPFLTKMASALVVLITALIYMLLGVTTYTNRISDYENAASAGTIDEASKLSSISEVIAGVTSAERIGLLLCICILPCVLMFISYRLYIKHYKLDEEEYDRIVEELKKKA